MSRSSEERSPFIEHSVWAIFARDSIDSKTNKPDERKGDASSRALSKEREDDANGKSVPV